MASAARLSSLEHLAFDDSLSLSISSLGADDVPLPSTAPPSSSGQQSQQSGQQQPGRPGGAFESLLAQRRADISLRASQTGSLSASMRAADRPDPDSRDVSPSGSRASSGGGGGGGGEEQQQRVVQRQDGQVAVVAPGQGRLLDAGRRTAHGAMPHRAWKESFSLRHVSHDQTSGMAASCISAGMSENAALLNQLDTLHASFNAVHRDHTRTSDMLRDNAGDLREMSDALQQQGRELAYHRATAKKQEQERGRLESALVEARDAQHRSEGRLATRGRDPMAHTKMADRMQALAAKEKRTAALLEAEKASAGTLREENVLLASELDSLALSIKDEAAQFSSSAADVDANAAMLVQLANAADGKRKLALEMAEMDFGLKEGRKREAAMREQLNLADHGLRNAAEQLNAFMSGDSASDVVVALHAQLAERTSERDALVVKCAELRDERAAMVDFVQDAAEREQQHTSVSQSLHAAELGTDQHELIQQLGDKLGWQEEEIQRLKGRTIELAEDVNVANTSISRSVSNARMTEQARTEAVDSQNDALARELRQLRSEAAQHDDVTRQLRSQIDSATTELAMMEQSGEQQAKELMVLRHHVQLSESKLSEASTVARALGPSTQALLDAQEEAAQYKHALSELRLRLDEASSAADAATERAEAAEAARAKLMSTKELMQKTLLQQVASVRTQLDSAKLELSVKKTQLKEEQSKQEVFKARASASAAPGGGGGSGMVSASVADKAQERVSSRRYVPPTQRYSALNRHEDASSSQQHEHEDDSHVAAVPPGHGGERAFDNLVRVQSNAAHRIVVEGHAAVT